MSDRVTVCLTDQAGADHALRGFAGRYVQDGEARAQLGQRGRQLGAQMRCFVPNSAVDKD